MDFAKSLLAAVAICCVFSSQAFAGIISDKDLIDNENNSATTKALDTPLNNNDLETIGATATPETGTLALLGIGLLGLQFSRKKIKKEQ
ncbi:hypothetical protein A9Q99_20445 [Gammaproteobacteria bacterium 45_16_T64]|nr:hypothetical protein A9Q99_20445 [Gammaproteobacteria bacterium 45_16_T64]